MLTNSCEGGKNYFEKLVKSFLSLVVRFIICGQVENTVAI